MNKYPLVGKCLAVGIILLFIGTCIIPAIAQVIKESSQPASKDHWLYVGGSGPGNYTTIQDAINDASDGDTVFVYDDSSPYVENVKINKSVFVLGENRDTTEIKAYYYNDDIITVFADNVVVSSFTIRDGPGGIGIYSSHDVTIVSNKISETGVGIDVESSSNISILDNIFDLNYIIVVIQYSSNCNIHYNDFTALRRTIGKTIGPPSGPPLGLGGLRNSSIQGNIFRGWTEYSYMMGGSCCDNIISNNSFTGGGFIYIDLKDSNRNTICNNSITGISAYGDGISLAESNNNIIKNNYIGQNTNGIMLSYASNNNSIIGNTFDGNDLDCYLSSSNNNLIYYNNFITQNHVFDDGENNWNNGYPSAGNHWYSYTGVDHLSGPGQNESGPDGVGDTPYDIPGGFNQDHYPLMLPYGMTQLAFALHGGLGFSGTITNVGNTTAFMVHFRQTVEGGFILRGRDSLFDAPKPLLPGEKVVVKSRMIFGFGKIQLTIAFWADNAPYMERTSSATVILFFIIGLH